MIDIDKIAKMLREAYSNGTIPSLRNELDSTDADQAYKIQANNTQYWLSQGRKIVGRKIGLTAKSVQAQLGVDQPDFGVLFSDMIVPDGGTVASELLLQPKVEAEVALILERDLFLEQCTVADIIHATAYAVPALEIVDSRIQDWKITFSDTVADNASSALFVLGNQPRSLSGLDLRTCGMAMEFNGLVVSHGCGVACLGHPLEAAAWLVRTLAKRGEGLKAGDILLTGALGPMVSLVEGSDVRAMIGGLGTVGFSYRGQKG